MYLGSSGMDSVKQTFYMPFLANMKEKAPSPQDIERVAELDKLPKIELLTSNGRKGLPQEADTLIVHGSYKMIYTHLTAEKYIIAIRDIGNNDRDDNGRNVPFMLLVMSDSLSDIPQMNKLAAHISNNLKSVCDELAGIIHYDLDVNGICFELEKMNRFVAGVNGGTNVRLADGKNETVAAREGEIALLIVPSGITSDYTLKELNMGKKTAFVLAPDADKNGWRKVNGANSKLPFVIAGVVIIGVILYFLLR